MLENFFTSALLKQSINGILLSRYKMFMIVSISLGPGVPEIIPDECSVTNNNIVLSWRMLDKSSPDGYLIEIDDGIGGSFEVVYETDKNFCSLGGLQFHSTYRARVRAFNRAGEGEPSEVVYLTTPDGKLTIR